MHYVLNEDFFLEKHRVFMQNLRKKKMKYFFIFKNYFYVKQCFEFSSDIMTSKLFSE